ncbi:MAG: hypothetical protein ACRD50_10540 [Candidatus Acidiferrales bacterium]
MQLRPRQIVIRAREIATAILRAVERERLVENFIDSYVKDHNRPGRATGMDRRRELLELIRREALLAMVAEVESEIPLRFGSQKGSQKRKTTSHEDVNNRELFRQQFFEALAGWHRWNQEEFEAFLHDLALFERLGDAAPPARKGHPRKIVARVAGPFADRVGLILDPAMLEKARRAAAMFESDLRSTARAFFRKFLSRRER